MYPVIPEPRTGAHAVTFAKDQPQYLPLPAAGYYVESKWRFTWKERLRVLFRGVLYLKVMNFGKALQPIRPTVKREKYLG